MHKIRVENGQLKIEPKDCLNTYLRRFGGLRMNTRLKYAQILNRFLMDTPYDKISTDYIRDYLTRRAWSGITQETFETERRTIMMFVAWLEEKSIIQIDHEQLKGLPVASPKVSNKINDIKPQYLALLLQTVIEFQPRIAFAVLLMIAAGIRPGELLNLTKSAVTTIGPWGKDGWILIVSDRQLRTDWKEFCKRTRRQKAQSMGEFGARIYKQHLEHYVVDNNDALFVDENGNAMTYQAFQKRFSRVKKHFIKKLKASDDPAAVAYGSYLETCRWGPHIGRGIFSNDAARNTTNIAELAGMRGDRHPGSSIPYIQADAVRRLGRLQQHMADDLLRDD